MTVAPNTIILYVLNDSRFFISHRLHLASSAQAAGYAVHVAVPDERARAEIEAAGFTFHRYALSRSGTKVQQEIKSIFALYRLYQQLSPAIIHHLTIKPILYGSIAARWAKIPAVVNAFTGLGYLFIGDGYRVRGLRQLVKRLGRYYFRRKNYINIFQNPDDEALLSTYKMVSADNTVVIRSSGVPVDKLLPVPEPVDGCVQIVFVGRMLWVKGIADFVAAAEHLLQKGVKARFLLVGDSDLENPACVPPETLQKWHDAGIVDWLGWREDVINIYQQSHIACLPSYREGVPKVLLEAGALGKPIVTTDAPGCRETVIHNENGFIVPPHEPLKLANALERLITQAELRLQMGAASRELVCREFSQAKVARETLAVYRQLSCVV